MVRMQTQVQPRGAADARADTAQACRGGSGAARLEVNAKGRVAKPYEEKGAELKRAGKSRKRAKPTCKPMLTTRPAAIQAAYAGKNGMLCVKASRCTKRPANISSRPLIVFFVGPAPQPGFSLKRAGTTAFEIRSSLHGQNSHADSQLPHASHNLAGATRCDFY